MGGLLTTTLFIGEISRETVLNRTIKEVKVIIANYIKSNIEKETSKNKRHFILSIRGGSNILKNWNNNDTIITLGSDAQVTLTCVSMDGAYAHLTLTSYGVANPAYGYMSNWVIA